MNLRNNVSLDSIVKQLFFNTTLVLLLLFSIFAASWYLITEEQKALENVENHTVRDLNSLMSQVDFLRSQVKLYRLYGNKYKDLVRKGIVKNQDRVFWVDSMIQMQQSLVMPAFTFNFSPEVALSSDHFNAVRIEKPPFNFSRLTIKMRLQHEGDLLTFLDAINERVSPLYLLERCRSERAQKSFSEKEQVSFNVQKGNINVDCSLVIFHSHSQLAI